MIRVVAKIHIKPGTEDDVRQACQEMIDKSRQEAGNGFYDLLRSAEEENTLAFLEQWDSQAVLDEHMKTAHFKSGNEALEPYLTAPMDIQVFTE